MLAFLRFDALILGAIAAYMAGAVSLGIATAVCAIIGTAAARDFTGETEPATPVRDDA
jgi:hypothetical protein